jgi:hypothetical protein
MRTPRSICRNGLEPIEQRGSATEGAAETDPPPQAGRSAIAESTSIRGCQCPKKSGSDIGELSLRRTQQVSSPEGRRNVPPSGCWSKHHRSVLLNQPRRGEEHGVKDD